MEILTGTESSVKLKRLGLLPFPLSGPICRNLTNYKDVDYIGLLYTTLIVEQLDKAVLFKSENA